MVKVTSTMNEHQYLHLMSADLLFIQSRPMINHAQKVSTDFFAHYSKTGKFIKTFLFLESSKHRNCISYFLSNLITAHPVFENFTPCTFTECRCRFFGNKLSSAQVVHLTAIVEHTRNND